MTDGSLTGSDSFILTITNIQDRPFNYDFDVYTNKNVTLAFATSTWYSGYTDLDDDPIDRVRIAKPTTGDLYVNGVLVTNNIDVFSYDLGNVTYEPPTDYTGTATSLFRMFDEFNSATGNAILTYNILDTNAAPILT